MFGFDSQRVWLNARKATTEDLLDRITVYREGMEPEALAIFAEELTNRGVDEEAIRRHADTRNEKVIQTKESGAARCSYCRRPAVAEGWGWHRLLRLFPIFPRRFRWCEQHQPESARPLE